jgi:hypothetical protein
MWQKRMKPKSLFFIIVFSFFVFANMSAVAHMHTHALDNFHHHLNYALCFFDTNDNLYAINCNPVSMEYSTVSNEPILVHSSAGLKSEPESYHFILRAPPIF